MNSVMCVILDMTHQRTIAQANRPLCSTGNAVGRRSKCARANSTGAESCGKDPVDKLGWCFCPLCMTSSRHPHERKSLFFLLVSHWLRRRPPGKSCFANFALHKELQNFVAVCRALFITCSFATFNCGNVNVDCEFRCPLHVYTDKIVSQKRFWPCVHRI